MIEESIRKIISERGLFLVVGLGRSGIESARFLSRLGANVACTDSAKKADFLSDESRKAVHKELGDAGVAIYFDNAVPDLDPALVVISPGVPLDSPVPSRFREREIPIISELELGIELSKVPSVMVTGTNGKSTTVSILQSFLETERCKPILCGNIGVPVISVLEESGFFSGDRDPSALLVVEASSYQLESCSVVKPKMGIFLNLSENHLERHKTMESYLAAKARLFSKQTGEDFAILNGDDPLVSSLAKKMKGEVALFGGTLAVTRAKHYARIKYDPSQGVDQIAVSAHGREFLFSCHNALLIGLHNRYNLAAALLAACLYGVSADELQVKLASFEGLSHRIEPVLRTDRLFVINDSKSTTVASSFAALRTVLEAFPTIPVTLLVGGLSKLGSWDPLIELVSNHRERVTIWTFGVDGPKLSDLFALAGVESLRFPTLASLVPPAVRQEGIILLSPGCLSFDEFTDFENRGDVFKSLIHSASSKAL